jgi:hypothetical protein
MKTLTNRIHIEKTGDLNAVQIWRICELLGWDHETYCYHQYEEFELFIALACRDLPRAAAMLRYSAHFRRFYNQEWMQRNEYEFLPFANSLTEDLFELNDDSVSLYEGMACGDPVLLEEYLAAHSARELFYNEEFNKRYCQLIDQILPLCTII